MGVSGGTISPLPAPAGSFAADRPRQGLALDPDRRLHVGRQLPAQLFNGTPFISPVYYVDPSFKIPEIYGELHAYVGDDIDRIMIPRTATSGDTDNQLVNSNRLKKQLHQEQKKGAYWYYYGRPASP